MWDNSRKTGKISRKKKTGLNVKRPMHTLLLQTPLLTTSGSCPFQDFEPRALGCTPPTGWCTWALPGRSWLHRELRAQPGRAFPSTPGFKVTWEQRVHTKHSTFGRCWQPVPDLKADFVFLYTNWIRGLRTPHGAIRVGYRRPVEAEGRAGDTRTGPDGQQSSAHLLWP